MTETAMPLQLVESREGKIKSPGVQAGADQKKRNPTRHFTVGNGSFQSAEKKWLFDGVEETEQRTLGLILWEPEKITRARNILTPSGFRYEKHQLIFGAMLAMAEQGIQIDVFTLWMYLGERGQLDSVGGSSYLTYLPLIALREVEL